MNDYELEIYNKVKEEKQRQNFKNLDKTFEHFFKIIASLMLLLTSSANVYLFSVVTHLTNYNNKFTILLLIGNIFLLMICSYTYFEVFRNE